jgi:uncharacterized protein YerC
VYAQVTVDGAGGEALTPESVQARRAAAEQAAELDAAGKQSVLETYDQAADLLKAAAQSAGRLAELQAMADRWAVVELLERGLPYREVSRLTGVSVTTIGRVARYLTQGNGGYTTIASRLRSERGD